MQQIKINNLFNAFLVALVCQLTLFGNAHAQKTGTSLTFFAQDGQPFFLIIDGEKQNAKPETKVKVSGLTGVSVMAKFIFKDEKIPALDERFSLTGVDPGYYNITYAIRWSEKKKRMYTKLINWENINQLSGNAATDGNGAGSTTTNQPGTQIGGNGGTYSGNTSEQVQINTPGVSVQINNPDGTVQQVGSPTMQVGVNTGGQSGGLATQTRTTHTSTTISSTTSTTSGETKPNIGVPTQSNGGSGSAGACSVPMVGNTFNLAIASLRKTDFEKSKLEQAKTIAKRNCLSTDQVKQVMAEFSFEASKLEFAKYAFKRCTDKDNYFLVNDAFDFSASKDELNKYIDDNN
jgi:Domain of unknown function (DUF4476)